VLLLAYGSRRLLTGPDRLAALSRAAKPAVGVVLVVLGALTVSGADKAVETAILDQMPAWLVDLATRL
jgi:hypothetical protein